MSKVLGALALTLGLLILIGSIVVFLIASATVNDYESTAGQLARGLDSEEEDYESALTWQMCSGIGLIIGAILTTVGFYLGFRGQPYHPLPQQPPPLPRPPQYMR